MGKIERRFRSRRILDFEMRANTPSRPLTLRAPSLVSWKATDIETKPGRSILSFLHTSVFMLKSFPKINVIFSKNFFSESPNSSQTIFFALKTRLSLFRREIYKVSFLTSGKCVSTHLRSLSKLIWHSVCVFSCQNTIKVSLSNPQTPPTNFHLVLYY